MDCGLWHFIEAVCLVGATFGVYTTEDGVFGDVSIEELGSSLLNLQTIGIFNDYRITFAGLTGFADHCKTLNRF